MIGISGILFVFLVSVSISRLLLSESVSIGNGKQLVFIPSHEHLQFSSQR